MNNDLHINNVHYNLGRMDQIYTYCDAKFWFNERNQKNTYASLTFTMCYTSDKVNLLPLLKPLLYLLYLYTLAGPEASSFCKNIRAYNSILACTSFAVKLDQQFCD